MSIFPQSLQDLGTPQTSLISIPFRSLFHNQQLISMILINQVNIKREPTKRKLDSRILRLMKSRKKSMMSEKMTEVIQTMHRKA